MEDFDREVYGRVPKETPKVTWEVTEAVNEKVGEIDVVTKKLVGRVDNSAYPHVTGLVQATQLGPGGRLSIQSRLEHRPGPTDDERVRVRIEVRARDCERVKGHSAHLASRQPTEQRVTALMHDLHQEPSQWRGHGDQDELRQSVH